MYKIKNLMINSILIFYTNKIHYFIQLNKLFVVHHIKYNPTIHGKYK